MRRLPRALAQPPGGILRPRYFRGMNRRRMRPALGPSFPPSARGRMSRLVLCAFALLQSAVPLSSGQPAPAAPAHPIGFRIIESADASRATPRFRDGRPIQIAVWYPASRTSLWPSPRMTYRDYLLLTATETSFGTPTDAAATAVLAGYRSFLAQAGATPAETEAFLSTRMRASRAAAAAPGSFPLVLIAQGNGQSAHDQAFLAELLAARGYTVATTPSQANISGPMKSEREIPAQVEEQTADLAFALRVLRGEEAEKGVRPGRYAVVGHSFGARSALLLAMRDPRVAAIVSLDGGIGGSAGKGLLDMASGFDRTRAAARILHLYEEGDRFMVPDFDLLRSLTRADRWLVRVDGVRHVHFSSAGVLVRSIPAVARRTSADERTAAAWDAIAETTASFLDRFLGPAAVPGARWTPPPSPLLHSVNLPAAAAPQKQ
jgi:dienelactone hydrolase